MKKDEIQICYQKLEAALQALPLPTSTPGFHRTAKAEEFMLMHEDEEKRLGFKHTHTRNYIFLLPEGEIFVPQTKEPFLQGEFDCSSLEEDQKNSQGKRTSQMDFAH